SPSARVTGTGSEAVNQIANIAAGWNYQFKLSSVGSHDGWGLGGDGAGNCVDMAEEAQTLFEQAGIESRIVDGTCDSSSGANGRIGHVWIEFKDPQTGQRTMFDPTGAALQHNPNGAFTNPLNNIPN
ncbi:MAG: transglutaminase-like domain-containing protein, partial [Myxococcota bacterium]|nr:transglutaminase-like domain-containing protein [Myxococcota bacterium]